jgi:soluble lytic murein transglycosylase-like protein
VPGSSLCGRVAAVVSPSPETVISSKRSLLTQLGIAAGSIAAIVVAANISRPYYMSRKPIGSQLIEHRYVDSTKNRAPWLSGPAEVALATPQFLLDRELFAMDLLRTGKLNQKRARALADVAVREAYTRKVPPALVLGVMLTENDELKSSARSNVGAVGLMQVHPRPWRGLGRKFGTNVRTDSTNLKYGIFILGWVAEKANGLVNDQAGPDAERKDVAWRKALLKYNGCVRGTNTRGCGAYPDVVRREVERSARASCRGASFDRCVAEPMWLARREAADTIAGANR